MSKVTPQWPSGLRARVNEMLALGAAKLLLRSGPRSPILKPPFRNVLVIRLDAVGDGVLMSPFYRELKRNLPDSRVTAVVTRAVGELMEFDPNVDRVLRCGPVPKGYFPSLRQISEHQKMARKELAEEFDLIVCPRFSRDERQALDLAAMVGPSAVLGYDNTPGYAKIFPNLVDVDSGVKHEVDRNLDLLKHLGLSIQDRSVAIYPREDDFTRPDALMAELSPPLRRVAIGFGAAAASRRWPIEKFAELMGRLSKKTALGVVIIAGPGEEEVGQQLHDLLEPESCLLSGLGLREIGAALSKCELFVGNDSGPAHMAAAAGCATVVVSPHPEGADPHHFNSPERFRPFGPNTVVVRPARGEIGCENGCVSEEAHCIKTVETETVLAAIDTVWTPHLRN